MSWIWTGFLLLSVLCACLSGQIGILSAAVLDGARAGVTLAVSLAGPICLWSGLSRVMADTGWTDALARWMAPVLRRLFPLAWQDSETRQALCSNLSANLLGLGNAATPAGVRAVRRMAVGHTGQASDELCRLVILNTASIQLLPATVAAVRSAQGCTAPFDILPAVWLTSLCSVAAGLLAGHLLSRWPHWRSC